MRICLPDGVFEKLTEPVEAVGPGKMDELEKAGREDPPVDSGPLGDELGNTGGAYVARDAESGGADEELAWSTGEPSVDEDELEYMPTREAMLTLKEKEEVLAEGPYGSD